MCKNLQIFTISAAFFLLSGLMVHSYAQQWTMAGSVSNPGSSPSISVASPDVVWIADGVTGTPKVFRTTNGGTNWVSLPVAGISQEIYCIWGMSDNIAFAGEGVVSSNANLFKTTNGGNNWVSVLQTTNNQGFFNGLGFTKANASMFGLAIAKRIYRSTDYGGSWVMLNSGTNGVSNAQNSLMIVDNDFYGYGLDNGAARIRLTTDNGGSWLTENINLTGNYTCAIAFNSNKILGVAATSSSMPNISRTTDGGNSWSTVNIGSGLTGSTYLQWIPGTSVVYILGSNGAIKRSTDNGLSWVLTPTPGVNNITFFDFVNLNNIIYGYAVSSDGPVIKLVDSVLVNLTGIKQVNSGVPSNFSLEQNYPNPFNPGTDISYDLASNGPVKLTVIDALGRAVVTLVSEEQNAGKHGYYWDASKYSSGIYLCRLETNGFSETKKMILMK